MFGRLFILFAYCYSRNHVVDQCERQYRWLEYVCNSTYYCLFGAYFVRREGANTLRDVQLKIGTRTNAR